MPKGIRKLLRRSVLTLVTALVAVGWAQTSQPVNAALHCDYPDVARMDLMLRNVGNMVNYYEENLMDYDIRVVANSACIQLLLGSLEGTRWSGNQAFLERQEEFNERMRALNDFYNVTFEACNNTLTNTSTDPGQLLPFVEVVPAGVVRLIDLQAQGYGYIKVR